MKAKVIRSSKRHKEYWKHDREISFDKSIDASIPNIVVNSTKQYQEYLGFGGAFTEAAAYTLSKLSEDKQDEVIKAYFSEIDGLGYKLGRVHIHSCDFALENYTYIEENDTTLDTFNMSREEKWVLPFIEKAEKELDDKIKLLASPWSPPAWMKDNNDMNFGGSLLPEYNQVWADYYVKFIEGMKDYGYAIWGLTIQNEPEAVQCWDSCIYTAEQERDFIKNYLGPTLEKNDLKDVKIVIWDHNRDEIVTRSAGVLVDVEASKYVWGIGNHWYVSEEFENLGIVHDMFPDKHIIFTEGCVELTNTALDADSRTYMGNWGNGEMYGRNIIGDMNNYSEAFIDWNLVLDEKGGPNHVGNYCEAPIMIDTNNNEIIYNTSYYYIGHFSKYIRPGYVRTFNNHNVGDDVCVTSFTKDDRIVVVVQNSGWIKKINLIVDGQTACISLPDNSITTYIIENN